MLRLTSNVLPRQGLTLKPLTLVTGARYVDRVGLIRKVMLSLCGTLQSPVVRASLAENDANYHAPVPSGSASYDRQVTSISPSDGDTLRDVQSFRGWTRDQNAYSIFETLTGNRVNDVESPSEGDAYSLLLASYLARAMVDPIPSVVLLPDVVCGKLQGSYSAHKRLASVLCGVASPHVVLVVGANPDTQAAVKEAIDRGDLDPEDYVEWNEEK